MLFFGPLPRGQTWEKFCRKEEGREEDGRGHYSERKERSGRGTCPLGLPGSRVHVIAASCDVGLHIASSFWVPQNCRLIFQKFGSFLSFEIALNQEQRTSEE